MHEHRTIMGPKEEKLRRFIGEIETISGIALYLAVQAEDSFDNAVKEKKDVFIREGRGLVTPKKYEIGNRLRDRVLPPDIILQISTNDV